MARLRQLLAIASTGVALFGGMVLVSLVDLVHRSESRYLRQMEQERQAGEKDDW